MGDMVLCARWGWRSPGARGPWPVRHLHEVDGAHLHVHRDDVVFIDGTQKRGPPRLQVWGIGAVGKGRHAGYTPLCALLLFLFLFLLVVLFLLAVAIVISLGDLFVGFVLAVVVVIIIVVLRARGIPSGSVAVSLDGLIFGLLQLFLGTGRELGLPGFARLGSVVLATRETPLGELRHAGQNFLLV